MALRQEAARLGQVSGVPVGYGVLRFIAEFFREPEALYGAMPLGLSAGQWLSVPMIVIGLVCFVILQRRGIAPVTPPRR